MQTIPHYLRSILILSFNLCLGLPSGPLPSGLPTNLCHHSRVFYTSHPPISSALICQSDSVWLPGDKFKLCTSPPTILFHLPLVPDVWQGPVQRYPIAEKAIETVYFVQLLFLIIVFNRQEGGLPLLTNTLLLRFCFNQLIVVPVYFYTISHHRSFL